MGMDQNTQNQQERREARRKRRIRNQILAYITVFIFILAVAAGIVFGVRYLKQESLKNAQAKQDQEQQVSQMLSEEETSSQPETESSETVPELTREEKLDELVNELIGSMSIEDKVAGLFIVSPESITGVTTAVKAGNGTKDALGKYAVGGIVYNTKNIQTESQFKEMINSTKSYSIYPLFMVLEDEGGKVSPLSEKKLVTAQLSAAELAESGDADKAKETGASIGAYLSEYGINLDLAPVADIASVENSVMKTRAYGQTADQAKPLVVSMVEGLKEKNVSVCLKHFPGMGSTAQDTDAGLAVSDRSAEDFRANEFTVFQAGIDAGADMVLVSNMAAPSLVGDNTPCSLSSAVVTDILRGEMGYDGVIITDAMDMPAISEYYSADEAAVLAFRAGCDMILMPEDFEKAYTGVLDAVNSGVISEERINDALRRVYRIKYADKVTE